MIFEDEGDMKMCFDMMVDEIDVDLVLNDIINVQKESWTTVQQRSKGKAQKERTGLIIDELGDI